LSYTPFELDGIACDKEEMTADGTCAVTATLTNTGDRAGAEVVQLYIGDIVSSPTRPDRE
jgi:beta-glucosidase